jgi:hypothetical protein
VKLSAPYVTGLSQKLSEDLTENEIVPTIDNRFSKFVKVRTMDIDKKERGLIKPEVASELVINMISTFSLNEYYRSGLDKERYLKKLNDVIKIIKEGVAVFKD